MDIEELQATGVQPNIVHLVQPLFDKNFSEVELLQ